MVIGCERKGAGVRRPEICRDSWLGWNRFCDSVLNLRTVRQKCLKVVHSFSDPTPSPFAGMRGKVPKNKRQQLVHHGKTRQRPPGKTRGRQKA